MTIHRLSHFTWDRTLSPEEQDFADWAESRGLSTIFEFYEKDTVLVSVAVEEIIDGQIVARAVDVGDLPIYPPDVSVRDYLESRVRREHQALKDSL